MASNEAAFRFQTVDFLQCSVSFKDNSIQIRAHLICGVFTADANDPQLLV